MYFNFRIIIEWIKEKRFTGNLILIVHCKEGNITGEDKYSK